ncbi:hypothetical protein AOQ84DRAFT_221940 [Glonium stellatum]|uniref:Uncharacterized protein n=1 Tax=Glonium stellatum TaxID=574774 RepID=A0A8E2JYM8_9PEZI|nr:hypothetical protein AOQ84DRAFT_221940 [Glonium stellatum]
MSLLNLKKRNYNEASTSNIHIRSVRRKLSPSVPEPCNSSAPSSCSVSEDSALFSTGHSSSNETTDRDHDSTSSSDVSESSDDTSSGSHTEDEAINDEDGSEEESMDEVQAEIVTLPLPKKAKKPAIKAVEEIGQEVDLGARLKRFLPQLAASNRELEAFRAAGMLKERELEILGEEVGEEYIEMDLGLGVLEEKNSNTQDDGGEDYDNDDAPRSEEGDILGKLMGRTTRKDNVGIQELDDA